MAGRGQEEEEECEDCKLQTILRVNVFLSPLLETFAMFLPSEPTLGHSEYQGARYCQPVLLR